ncbi:hypothetical protein M422DRAFT_35522 [Sphaerobolus stellatus SS14]|uniref:Uncharacterized protein n=1 Tax=Sphaerobolus stellatus (strain SS14) TaxID=990650 RepID=A0A0C9TT42_SPHS4|nr:hypothetical protein M422DRAFT_35522 [Sphaerobolus stellatus SS14]
MVAKDIEEGRNGSEPDAEEEAQAAEEVQTEEAQGVPSRQGGKKKKQARKASVHYSNLPPHNAYYFWNIYGGQVKDLATLHGENIKRVSAGWKRWAEEMIVQDVIGLSGPQWDEDPTVFTTGGAAGLGQGEDIPMDHTEGSPISTQDAQEPARDFGGA